MSREEKILAHKRKSVFDSETESNSSDSSDSNSSSEFVDNQKGNKRKRIIKKSYKVLEESTIISGNSKETAPDEPNESAKKPLSVSSKKPIKKKETIEDIEKYVNETIIIMKKHYENDIFSIRADKPALKRIESIDDIYSRIMKKEAKEAFVKFGVLDEIKLWLEPLPDKSLPNSKIKKAMLDLLNNLSIEKIDLIRSGIGKIVHFYSKNTRESIEIRKMALKLMKKWKHEILKGEADDE